MDTTATVDTTAEPAVLAPVDHSPAGREPTAGAAAADPADADPSGPVARAHRLAEAATRAARRAEQDRSLPADLVGALRSGGMFGLTTPRALGGLEADPHTIVAVVEELSRADAATGWTVLTAQGGGYLAWLDGQVAAAIVARAPRPVIAGSPAPCGRSAGDDAGTLRITGRWPLSSGCHLADLLVGGFRTGTAVPRHRLALFQPSQVEMHDPGAVVGLRGAGLREVAVSDATVPPELTCDPFGPAREPGALYRLPHPVAQAVTLAGFPLGVARRALDEYAELARVKRTVDHTLLAETPFAQQDAARWEAAVRGARAGVAAALDRLWGEAQERVPAPRTRALFIGAVQHAMDTAGDVVDAALRAAGASQLYHRAPLQRCYRDVQAALHHPAFGAQARRAVGSTLLGAEPDRNLI